MTDMRVLISGAGIAGPVLAYWLAKAGAHVTVVEKAPSLLSNGQNIDISGTAVQIMKKMGLLDEVRRWNTREKGTQFINPTGQAFGMFPAPSKDKPSASPTSEFEILRGDLAKVLYGATKDNPSVVYKFGTTIERVLSNDEKAVEIEFSNGAVQKFDMLVAADGQWSKVRRQNFPSDSVQVVDKGMMCALFTVPRLPEDNDWWNIYNALGSRAIFTRPDPHGTIRAALSLMPLNEDHKAEWMAAAKNGRQTQQDLLRRDFADAGWQAQRLLAAMGDADDFYLQSVQQIRMSKWSTGRIICLGDAAYAPTPLTGMGTSLAIIGGYVLAGELSKLVDAEHPSKAFDAYEKAFRPFVEKIQDIPSFVPGIAHPATAWKRYLLHTVVWTASKILSIPMIAKRVGETSDDEDFPLAHYTKLEENAAN